MLRLGILAIFLLVCVMADSNNMILVTETASKTIRLKSVLSLMRESGSWSSSAAAAHDRARDESRPKQQKIFWSFKRLYAMPNWTTNSIIHTLNEISQVELMISLDAEVQDNLQLKYSTFNDSLPDSMYDLTIYNLTYADSGVYKCNLWNQKTIYYKLIVSSPIEKPDIKLEQSSPSSTKMILESTDLTIKCQSQYAYPLPSFKWFENGTELRPNESEVSYKLLDKETNSIESAFKIRKIKSDHHMRNLSCKLVQYQQDEAIESGEQLWQVSDTVTLNVAFKPIVSLDVFKSNNQLMTLSRDSTISLYQSDEDVWFRCRFRANPSDERIGIVWKVDGVVQETDRTRNPDVFSWRSRSNRRDHGKINLSCEVENMVGKSSFSVEIIQLYEPRLKLNTTRYIVDEFGAFQLNCSTDASPAPNLIEWRKYGSDSDEDDYQVVSPDSHLEFKSIRHTDTQSVYYVCVAVNSMNDSFGAVKFGEKKFTFDIDVRFKPQMNVVSKKLAVEPLTVRQNISCLCMANPQPVFNWYKNGVKLNSTKYSLMAPLSRGRNFFESVLTIADLAENDLNNKYECEAINQLGVNRLEIELVARSTPDQPGDLRALHVDFFSASVAWSAGFDGGLPQTFYMDINETVSEVSGETRSDGGLRIIPIGPSSANLTNLKHDSVYSVRLMARNSLGDSEWSDRITVQTEDITDASVLYLPVFNSLFLNVPKNRLEFEFKKNDTIIPICFRLAGVSLTSNRSGRTLKSSKCVSVGEGDYSSGRLSLEGARVGLIDEEASEETAAAQIGFDSSAVKSLKVSICFEAKQSVCAPKSTSAIIDTYNKISLSVNRNEMSDRRFGSLMSSSSRLSIVLIVAVCGSLIALTVVLFGTVIYCIRKRNFKLCKALLSQQQQIDSASDKSSSGSTGSTGSSRISSGSGDGKTKIVEKNREMPSVMSESEHRKNQQNNANKSFNIDIASISAPMSLGNLQTTSISDLNRSQTLVVGVPPMSMTGANSISLLTATAVSKTNSLNSRRAFTAALTATANTIIGKHKQQQQSMGNSGEIKVTEDEDKIRRQFGQFSTGLCSHFEDELAGHHSDGSERSSDDENNKHATIQVASSQTSSTAVSNCSSTNLGPPYTLYSPFESANNHNHQQIIVNKQGGGFCSDSTGSNSDPIAINNSLSSNSTTDSPTYGYNLSSQSQPHHHQDLMYNKPKSNPNKSVEQLESGYSTPSRPKKVVYEVIV